MWKRKIVNIVLILAVIALLGAFAFFVRVRPTADKVVVLQTAGMSCGGCSGVIEKALESNRGVASVEVDVDGGWVIVEYDSNMIKAEVIASTVSGLGYRSKVAELLSVEQFRAIIGRDPGAEMKSFGCAGRCNNKYSEKGE